MHTDDCKPRNFASNAKGGARRLILVSLSRFYANEKNMASVLPYITGESPVSLRLIEWFATNYVKKYNVFMTRVDPGSGETHTLNVYQSYLSQLKAFSKQQFDPFKRHDRIDFWYSFGGSTNTNTHVKTTVGQLNFFRWMLENGILDYVTQHAATIEAEMIAWQHAKHTSSSDDKEEEDEAVANASGVSMLRLGGTRTLAFE
jgi:hypothetical protein